MDVPIRQQARRSRWRSGSLSQRAAQRPLRGQLPVQNRLTHDPKVRQLNLKYLHYRVRKLIPRTRSGDIEYHLLPSDAGHPNLKKNPHNEAKGDTIKINAVVSPRGPHPVIRRICPTLLFTSAQVPSIGTR